jgi:hypothetical protein
MFNLNLKKQVHFNAHMGRMGNQMFQYACARNLELNFGYTCSLDDMSQLDYFQLGNNARWSNAWKSKLFFHLAKRLNGMSVAGLDFEDMFRDYSTWLPSINQPTMVWGFFQSERYFKASSTAIRSSFRIKPQYQIGFQSFLRQQGLVLGAYHAIHLRRTDYKDFKVKGLRGEDFTLPLSYYEKALEMLGQDKPLVVVSDDPAYCQEVYGHMPNVIVSAEDAITDFQIMSNAQKLAISNSTFAWWAAWLNADATKIYCPQYFLGFKEGQEVPINIYPDTWQQISVPEKEY